MSKRYQPRKDSPLPEESKKKEPVGVDAGQLHRQHSEVTMEALFALMLEIRDEVRELKRALNDKALKLNHAAVAHRIQVYFREGAEVAAKELLAAAVTEYLALDPGLGDAVVTFGVVEERPWCAFALLSKDIIKPRFAKILKTKLAAAKNADLSTVKPFPNTKLFAMPLLDPQELALTVLPRILRGRQPQEDNSSLISQQSLLE